MRIENFTPTDAEHVLSVLNRSSRFDQLTMSLFIEKVLEDPDTIAGSALTATIAGRIVGFLHAVTRLQSPEQPAFIKLLAVDPLFQRKGVGSALLARAEARLWLTDITEIRIFESSPNYLLPGIDPRLTDLVVFFEKHGYQRFGESANMDVVLSGRDFGSSEAERALRSQGVEIRRAQVGDRQAVLELVNEHWPPWQAEVSRTLDNNPITLHLALRKGRVIGFSAYDGNNLNTGWFGPMGTDPSEERNGIGRVLLLRCLQDMKSQGHDVAVIPGVGPYRFYLRHAGAMISRVFWRYRKSRP